MLSVRQATDADREVVRALFSEYLWAVCPPWFSDAAAAGLICVRTIGPRLGEIKRMYVRPAFRREGIGRALVDAAVAEMRAAGYARLRLDSARFMSEAHSVYRAAGFREIEPYLESEVPREFHAHWLFMELPLVEHPGQDDGRTEGS